MRVKCTIFSILLTAALMTACAENITEAREEAGQQQMMSPNLMRASFTQIQDSVLTPTCAISGCHGDQIFPNLSANQSFGNIVNQAASSGLYIDPGDAEMSYLFLKVSRNTGDPAISGNRMPRNGTPLTQAKLDSIRKWINDGAMNN
ncbi:MAG: hypothetical protein ACRBF0_21830 [Calditrichia bacterium]